MPIFKHNNVVKDKITGYSGTITAYAVYTSGEVRYLVENVDRTGRPVECWYDESRLMRED